MNPVTWASFKGHTLGLGLALGSKIREPVLGATGLLEKTL